MSWHKPNIQSHLTRTTTETVSSRCSPRCATRGERGSGSERPTNGARAGHPRGRARDTRAPAQAPRAPAVDSRVALREGCLGGCSKTPISRATPRGDPRARRPRLRRPLAPTPRFPPRAPRCLHAVLTPPSPVPPVPPPPFADPPARRPSSPGASSPGPHRTIAEADQPPAPRRHAPRRRRAVPARRRQVAGLPGVHVRRGVHLGGRRRRWLRPVAWRRRAPIFVQDRRGPGGGRGAGVHRRGGVRAGVPDPKTHRAVPHGEDHAVVDRRDAPVVAPSRQGEDREESGEPDAHGERVVSRRRAQTQAPTRTTNRSEEG